VSELWVVSNEYWEHAGPTSTRVVGVVASLAEGQQLATVDLTGLVGKVWTVREELSNDGNTWLADYTRNIGHRLEYGSYIVKRYDVKGEEDGCVGRVA
jgi:hypothetical protein